MKNTTNCAKQLTALLKKLPEPVDHGLPQQDDPVAVLVQSFLLWEASTDKAKTAYERLTDHIVDFNDLRMCMPHELAEYIGVRYPLATDRCQRLRATLRNIFLREHTVSLDGLKAAGKRDVKKYIESLDGMTPYVAARVMLLAFDSHAIPVDEQMRTLLVEAGVADEEADVAEVSAWLSRQIKASQGTEMANRFQVWVEASADKVRTAGKKTTKKKTPTKKPGTRKKTSRRTTPSAK